VSRRRSGPLIQLALCALTSTTACAPRLTVGGSLRGETVVPAAGGAQHAVRSDMRASGTAPLGRGRLDAEMVPTLVARVDGVSAQRAFVRGRAAYVPDARARFGPSVVLGVERGTTRASDVASEPADPRPASATLTADRVVVEAALRTRIGTAGRFTTSATVERGGGVGSSVSVLPRLDRSEAGAGLTTRGPGRGTFGAFARASRTVVGDGRPWEARTVDGQWQRPLGQGRTVSVSGGGVFSQADEQVLAVHPIASLRFTQSARGPRPGVQLALDRNAEPDRLDGDVRDRHRLLFSIETQAVSTISFRGTLQGLADVGSIAPRRALGVDAILRTRLTEDRTMEYGVAHLVQSLGDGTVRGETRLTIAVRSALFGGPCRNSC